MITTNHTHLHTRPNQPNYDRWNGKIRRLSPTDREALRAKVEGWCRDGLRLVAVALFLGGLYVF